ncbi:hypothetical protein [Nitrososphaera viennensis]|uniref:Uncharacterized protein n=2 Tax=Nitrososphaera viennensis TaxID=1034015 RepID=A0A060HSF4_9ARCH|nr:hypothetical protein [Nitrososphaera viennensis]AIC16097.1 hypothetical protein NVIE_1884 [Nitrososphaera viennensis EN76]UVS68064.1 hypothetical protein NWT39_09135 [Nitrososphaera viennensis]
MHIHITQFNVQLYFRRPALDSELLGTMFSGVQGFEARPVADDYGTHPMQGTMSFYREGFRIAPVQSNVLPFRILQVMSYPNTLKEPDAETLACLRFATSQLQEHLHIDIENDIYAVRVVSHAIVDGSGQRVLSKLSSIENVPSLAGRYVAHKNPMDALQIVTKTGSELSQESWSDIRVSQFKESSYVVTIFHETGTLALALDWIAQVKQFVATMVQEMEQAAA